MNMDSSSKRVYPDKRSGEHNMAFENSETEKRDAFVDEDKQNAPEAKLKHLADLTIKADKVIKKWENLVTTKRMHTLQETNLMKRSESEKMSKISSRNQRHLGLDLDTGDLMEPIRRNASNVSNGKPGTSAVGKEITTKALTQALNKKVIEHFVLLSQGNSETDQVDLEHLHILFDKGADINCSDKYGQTLLHEVARSWHTDVAVFLIEKGININKPDKYGRTALHVAAATDYPEMIEFLIDHGADIESKTSKELQTPLHFAARNDAVEACKVLIKLGATMEIRDNRMRTPLHVAAELDRSETARWLVEHGAEVGVMDSEGLSCMTHMITKMGPVAKDALDTFHKMDRANRKQYFYLNYLEPDLTGVHGTLARTPLQVIVGYKQLDIIMHPVIIKLIELKWEKFGRFGALRNFFINLIYILFWTVLAVGVHWQERYLYNFPGDAWRIVFWILAFGMTLYFVCVEIWEIKASRRKFRLWLEWREKQINGDLKFTHPKWPEEKAYLLREIESLNDMLPAYFSDFWNYFDWTVYFLNFVVLITHIVDIYAYDDSNRHPACCYDESCVTTTALIRNSTLTMKQTCDAGFVNNLSLSAWNNRIFVLNIILMWLRLMKNIRAFRTLGPFVVMLGKIFYDILRFLFLYTEFYVPYACAFWMIFGDQQSISSMQTVDRMLFSLYRITLVDDYQFDEMQAFDIVMAYILIGTFLGISAILIINLFIALLSDTFQRVYDNANANAVMQQAILILSIEENLTRRMKARFRRFIVNKCSPLMEYYDDDLTTLQDDNLKKVTFQIKDQIDELCEFLKIDHNQEPDSQASSPTANDGTSFPYSHLKPRDYYSERLLSSRPNKLTSLPDFKVHDGMHRLKSDLSTVSDRVSNIQEGNEKVLKQMQKDISQIKKALQQFMMEGDRRKRKKESDITQRNVPPAALIPPPVFPIEITTLTPAHQYQEPTSQSFIEMRVPHQEDFQQQHQPTQDELMRRLIQSEDSRRSFRSSRSDDVDLEMVLLPGTTDSPTSAQRRQDTVDRPSTSRDSDLGFGHDVSVRTVGSTRQDQASPQPGQDDTPGFGASDV